MIWNLENAFLDDSSEDDETEPFVAVDKPQAVVMAQTVTGKIHPTPPPVSNASQVVAMAQPVDIPGDIQTLLTKKLFFNAPFRNKHTNQVEITNISAHRIAWTVRSANTDRLSVEPSCGVLDPNETILVAVSCEAFDYDQHNVYNDRIIIE